MEHQAHPWPGAPDTRKPLRAGAQPAPSHRAQTTLPCKGQQNSVPYSSTVSLQSHYKGTKQPSYLLKYLFITSLSLLLLPALLSPALSSPTSHHLFFSPPLKPVFVAASTQYILMYIKDKRTSKQGCESCSKGKK